MILKILVPMGGPTGNWTTGDRYECDDATAQRLIAAGRAVPWREEAVERAVVSPPETTSAPHAKNTGPGKHTKR